MLYIYIIIYIYKLLQQFGDWSKTQDNLRQSCLSFSGANACVVSLLIPTLTKLAHLFRYPKQPEHGVTLDVFRFRPHVVNNCKSCFFFKYYIRAALHVKSA